MLQYKGFCGRILTFPNSFFFIKLFVVILLTISTNILRLYFVISDEANNGKTSYMFTSSLGCFLFRPTVTYVMATSLLYLTNKENSCLTLYPTPIQKGKGYHLDLLVLAILVAVHSLLGLPWYVAATVSAIAHVNSLKKQSECTAPGEKPTFLGVRWVKH